MIKKQTSQPSIKRRERRINSTPLYKLENMTFFLTNGNATIASIEKFADDQLDFITSKKSILFLNEFRLSKGVTRSLYHDWIAKSEYLEKRHELAKEIIRLRRQKKIAEHNPSS